MRRLPCWPLLVIVLMFARSAVASDGPGIFQLDYFAGSWACEGTYFDLKTGASQAVSGTWDFVYNCEHGLLTDKFTSNDPNVPFTAWGWSAYNAGTQTLTRSETDSEGNWGASSAGGWGDDMLVWRGSMQTVDNGPYAVTNTFTRKAQTRFWVSTTVRPDGHARWFDAFKGNCRRDSPWGR